MGKVKVDITMSLDGFVAGPNATLEHPLGEGGERLHEWILGLAGWRSRHGLDGGATGADNDVMNEAFESVGAVVMGRRMFSGGSGPWEDDPNADAWWGEDPPFHVPVFVLTHHAREQVEKSGGTTFTFVTDGIDSALEQARAASGEQDVSIAGGADVIQQYLGAGAIDELQLHVVPLLLGDGVRLLDELGAERPQLELTKVIPSETVAHLRYRVVR